MNAPSLQFGRGPLWLLAFAVVAALVGWETDWGRRFAPEPVKEPLPAPQPVEIALLPEYRLDGGVAARRETVERPAFIPTRRPSPVPAQEVAKPRMQKGQFTLTGTAVVEKKAIAFLRENAGGKARSVRAGETINGLTVVDVAPDRVKLALGDESEELVLKVAAGPRVTIQPPQPGAPGAPGAAPVVGAPPGAPAAGGQPVAGQPAPMDSDQSILERRRAARAAQAAAEAAARAAAGGDAARATTPTAPVNAPSTPAVLPQSAAPTTQPDPAWADVYRRMQQPRR